MNATLLHYYGLFIHILMPWDLDTSSVACLDQEESPHGHAVVQVGPSMPYKLPESVYIPNHAYPWLHTHVWCRFMWCFAVWWFSYVPQVNAFMPEIRCEPPPTALHALLHACLHCPPLQCQVAVCFSLPHQMLMSPTRIVLGHLEPPRGRQCVQRPFHSSKLPSPDRLREHPCFLMNPGCFPGLIATPACTWPHLGCALFY